MKKFLLLGLLLLLSPSLHAVIYFSDNFEYGWTASNSGPWSFRNTDGGGSISTGTVRSSGEYGVTMQDNGAGQDAVRLYKSGLALSTTAYVRFYVKLDIGYFAALGAGNNIPLCEIYNAGSTIGIVIFISGTSQKPYIYNATFGSIDASGTMSENQWYCFEVMLGTPTATTNTSWWMDGVQQPAVANTDLSAVKAWSELVLGHSYGATVSSLQLSYDDVLVTDSRVGPLSGDRLILLDNIEQWSATSILPFTGRQQDGTCRISSSTAFSFSGQYGLKSEDNDTSNAASFLYAPSLIPVGVYGDIYARFYVYFPDTFFSSFTGVNQGRGIFGIVYTTAPATFVFNTAFVGTNNLNQPCLGINIIQNTFDITTIRSSVAITTKTWYCVEYMAPSSSNTIVRWWIDGVEQSSGTRTLNSHYSAAQVSFGSQYWQSGLTNTNLLIGTFYLDSCAVANIRIGQERPVYRKSRIPRAVQQ
jgi:hypothetical protein